MPEIANATHRSRRQKAVLGIAWLIIFISIQYIFDPGAIWVEDFNFFEYLKGHIPQLIMSLCISVIGTILFNYIMTLQTFCITLSTKEDNCQNQVKDILYNILHIYPYQLLSERPEEAAIHGRISLTEALKTFTETNPGRSLAFNIAIKSMQTIKDDGFILRERTVSEYARYLVTGINSSEESIFAVCRFRPFWFLPNTRHGEFLSYQDRGRHLKVFSQEAQNVSNRFRLTILNPIDIEQIIADAYQAVATDGSVANFGGELPEIAWFARGANGPNVVLLWAISTGSLDDLDDMMIFDGKLQLIFEVDAEENQRTIGNIKLMWDSIDADGKLEDVNTLINSINGAPGIANYDYPDGTNIFRNFRSLLEHLDSSENQLTFLHDVVEDLPTDIAEAIWANGRPSDLTWTSMYSDLVRAIDEGQVLYPDTVSIKLAQNVEVEVSWKENSKALEVGLF